SICEDGKKNYVVEKSKSLFMQRPLQLTLGEFGRLSNNSLSAISLTKFKNEILENNQLFRRNH
ncbi:MAG: hypothetical protein KAW47_04450, partial [Thermoplasmatales archaeon]|nr:hypothetical protein [Thermoplasmatales archaeon]